MKRIPLTQGLFATVDDCDYDELAKHKWCAHWEGTTCYARRDDMSEWKEGRRKVIRMHRHIMNAPSDMLVDHVNHDGLDNRRSNLRLCTKGQNGWNRKGPQKNSTTGYRGVFWHKGANKYMAQTRCEGKVIYIGLYPTAIEASRAFEATARKLFGEFAGGM